MKSIFRMRPTCGERSRTIVVLVLGLGMSLSLAMWAFGPNLAHAAGNDVSLTTDTVLSINGITVNVSGATASIESIVVDTTTFVATLQANSTLEVSAPNLNKLVTDKQLGITSDTCSGLYSKLSYTATSTEIVVTVTPSATLCSDPTADTSGGVGSRSGGGSSSATVAATPAATAVATREAQINSIMSAIAVLQAQINVMLQGTTVGPTISASITANLPIGSRGSSVKTLQQFLNARGFIVAVSGPGSVGNETEFFGSLTTQAVQKFQEEYGIASPGVPGYGTVGPKTRAKINELSGN